MLTFDTSGEFKRTRLIGSSSPQSFDGFHETVPSDEGSRSRVQLRLFRREKEFSPLAALGNTHKTSPWSWITLSRYWSDGLASLPAVNLQAPRTRASITTHVSDDATVRPSPIAFVASVGCQVKSHGRA